MLYQDIYKEVNVIAQQAGEEILRHYTVDVHVDKKADDSPVTVADLAANNLINQALQRLTPDIPIVSEENDSLSNLEAASQGIYWLVDPLDGTKSFIRHTGEFTVNIALIVQQEPVGGVVYVPVPELLYYTGEEGHAYKSVAGKPPSKIQVRDCPKTGLVVIASHSHRSQETDDFIETLEHVDRIISAASSQKFCIVAEGSADIYPRFGPTMEWDTGAGHAVLRAAGGRVDNLDGTALQYSKPELRNPHFIAQGAVTSEPSD